MRKRTVKYGLNTILAGVVSITLATFYHAYIARIFLLSHGGEAILVLLALILGGIACCFGIIATFSGMLRKSSNEPNVRLSYTIVFLASALIIFFFLFFLSISNREEPDLEPGRSITI